MYRNVYRNIPITRLFAYLHGYCVLCAVPFARSKFKSPEVYPTQFSLDKSAIIAFC